MQCALLVRLALGDEDAVLLFEGDSARHGHMHFALGALHFDGVGFDLYFYAGRYRNYFISNSRHSSLKSSGLRNPYQTSHIISPPTPALRADCPVINPRGVDNIEMPIPPTTGRIPVFAM